ncbi:MAG: hypothetical protein VB108_07150 [Anaerolineaceae bacterium]|nr:hypothetical protein [Anaerolineaceae bacterium]
MKKIDKTAIGTILILALLVLGIVLAGKLMPVSLRCQLKGKPSLVGPFGFIPLEFSKPVDSKKIESLIKTEPYFPGKLIWTDNKNAKWVFLKPLAEGQAFSLSVSAGLAGQNAEKTKNQSCSFQVRAPGIIAIKAESEHSDLFLFETNPKSSPIKLTENKGQILGFSPSPDGEKIVYALTNDAQGSDLWVVNRPAKEASILLDCNGDLCVAPAWSPALNEIAYTRQSAGLDTQGPKGAPRIWILEPETGKTYPLFTDSQEIGYGSHWSPDGSWLSVWDGSNGGIKIVNRQSFESLLMKSASGYLGAWSKDSQKLFVADVIHNGTTYTGVIKILDIHDPKNVVILDLPSENEDKSCDNPIPNPVNDWIALSIQPDQRKPERYLTIYNPQTKESHFIKADPGYVQDFFSWSPQGEYLVFQSFQLGQKIPHYQVRVWNAKTGLSNLIAEDYRMPAWIP